MTKKIDAKQLQINMFLCGTDRKWLELPFFRRKFLIETREQITTLQAYCQFVYIDTTKGVDVICPPEEQISSEAEIIVDETLSVPGMYPVGRVVELNTGELGLVTDVSPQDLLRPTLSMVTNAQKQLLTQEHILDLVAWLGKDIEIIQTLAMDDPIVELLMALHEQAKNGEL